MEHVKLSQNWMSVVGFLGKEEDGFVCPADNGTAITDYVEVRIDASKGSPLFELYDYTKEDWMKDHPDAKPFIERDGKTHGDFTARTSALTMDESIDRIIAYVHFHHDNHTFNTMFFEIGNVENRESVDLGDILTPKDQKEIIDFAKSALKKDFLKEEAYSQWQYGEYAQDLGVIDVKEDTKREWVDHELGMDNQIKKENLDSRIEKATKVCEVANKEAKENTIFREKLDSRGI